MQLSAITASLGRFFAELQRRKVLRVAATYLVGSWLVLQVAVALQTAWKLSDTFSGLVLNLLLLGFPVAVGLTWFFEWTPEGLKRTSSSGDGTIAKLQSADYALASALALVFVIGAVQIFLPREVTEQPRATAMEGPKTEAARLGDKSIAVLPFTNLSSDKDDAYFADGLTEEILNILVRLHGVRVTSRTSSFAFRGKDIDVKEIAKQLAVRHILEGSVRRDGETVRVTAQLIDTTNDAHIWSETYERKLADVFTLQDEIARSISGALNIELSVSGGGGAPTENMEAYRLYLQAREQASILSDNSMIDGIELFKRAIELDPDFAEAYTHMATFYIGRMSFDPDNREAYAKAAQDAIDTALKLKPNLATALAVLGGLAAGRRDWETADKNANKALEIEPSNAFALMNNGHRQIFFGYFEKAHKSFERLAQADPLFSFVPLRFLMLALAEGDNDACERFATKLQSLKGLAGYAAQGTLAHIARERGDLETAVRFARLSISSRGGVDALIEPVSKAMRDPKARSRAVAKIKEATEKEPALDSEGLLILIGATDDALDAMIARVKTRRPMTGAMSFAWHLVARGEGSNPKFKELMREMGFVDYWKKHGWPDRCRSTATDDFECS